MRLYALPFITTLVVAVAPIDCQLPTTEAHLYFPQGDGCTGAENDDLLVQRYDPTLGDWVDWGFVQEGDCIRGSFATLSAMRSCCADDPTACSDLANRAPEDFEAVCMTTHNEDAP